MEFDVLNLLILSAIKVWCLLALAECLLARSRNTSASNLHLLLALVLFGAAVSPFLIEVVPGPRFLVLPQDARIHFYWSYHVDRPSYFFTIFGSVYLLVTALLLLRRFVQIRHVFALLHRAKTIVVTKHAELLNELRTSMAIKSHVRIRYSNDIATPMIIGDIQSWILLPQESLLWDQPKLRRFLLHELAHIARRDWFIKQFGYFIAAVFWIVPPAWRVLAQLEWLAELSCDDVVIANEGRRSDYANDLLDVTANRAFCGAIGLTEARSHYDRIAAVLDGARIRHGSPIKLLVHALVFLLILGALGGIQMRHVKAPDNRGNYQLQPLVILDTDTQPLAPNAREDEITFVLYDKVAEENDIQITPSIKPEVIPKFEVTSTISDVWRENHVDVIQPLLKIVPEYPRKALRRGREGVVEIAFNILPTGETTDFRVLRAQPAGIFENAAINAVKQYRYAPLSRQISGVSEVFEFRLLEDAP